MYDLVINNGCIIDTVYQKKHQKNIGIIKDKIACISDEILIGKQVINAKNLMVCPGFIDPHGHIDGYEYAGELSACQGITTSIGGNCGLSPVHMTDFFTEQEKKGFPINQAEMIGHSFSLRKEVGITDVYKKATLEEVDKMCELTEQAFQDGACGLSFGLDYSPGASLFEITRLAKICAKYHRIMPVHTRLFTLYDNDSLYEILSIAKSTGVKLLISHFVYQYGEGLMKESLEIVEKARNQGIDITIDSGMYTDWATLIGTATFDERTLVDNDVKLSNLVVATGKYYGKCLSKERYNELRTNYPNESVICFTECKDEIYMALNKPYCIPSTDIGAYKKGEGHPQIAGTYPKYFKEMVREKKLLSLEEAVMKASLLPAKLFGFKDKGILEVSKDADITIIDFENIEDLARFPHEGYPDTKPRGVEYVIVNGKLVVNRGEFTKERPGRILRKLD